MTDEEWNKEVSLLEEAFRKIGGNLQHLPVDFCHWKNKADGSKKYLYQDYLPIYSFISDRELAKNLSEMRMCLDYQWSIYDLLKPGLIFERQHKLVIYQITAAILEGVMFEYMKAYVQQQKNKITDYLVDERMNSRSFGFGSMIDLFYKTEVINLEGKKYLNNLSVLRNTVHPRSFNRPETSYEKNDLLKKSISDIVEDLDRITNAIKVRVVKMRTDNVPF